jgi:hypothetical protein
MAQAPEWQHIEIMHPDRSQRRLWTDLPFFWMRRIQAANNQPTFAANEMSHAPVEWTNAVPFPVDDEKSGRVTHATGFRIRFFSTQMHVFGHSPTKGRGPDSSISAALFSLYS